MEFEQWLEDNPRYKMYNDNAARRAYVRQKRPRSPMAPFGEAGQESTDAIIERGRQYITMKERRPEKPTSNVREQHIRLGLGFLKLEENQNKTMLNIFLRNSVWKNHHPKDKYKLHYHYFIKQRKLAACWALETLADLFDVSEKTIRRWRDELVAEGSMTVVKRYNKPAIYIMGEVDEDGNEKYYADKVDEYVH